MFACERKYRTDESRPQTVHGPADPCTKQSRRHSQNRKKAGGQPENRSGDTSSRRSRAFRANAGVKDRPVYTIFSGKGNKILLNSSQMSFEKPSTSTSRKFSRPLIIPPLVPIT